MTDAVSFLEFPDRLSRDIRPLAAVFGAGHGSTYAGQDSSGYTLGPDAIRAASREDAGLIDHWDFDLGGPLYNDRAPCCLDLGNVPTRAGDNVGNRARIEAQTREIIAMGAAPVLLGGDDSVVIPFLSGFVDGGPIWIVQIDAHIDWRDTLRGERYGYSSPMRRASEMPHVEGIVQVGMRGLGSARRVEVEDALSFGSRLVTAREVHADGVGAALRHVPEGSRIVMTVDCDGLDPSIMPGVAAPSPGGLTYTQVIDIVAGVGRRGRLAGFDLVELFAPADNSGLSALTAYRIVANAIGAIIRQA